MAVVASDLVRVEDADAAALDEAIVKTVTYSDVFSYPLTVQEIHRYLTGVATTVEAVERSVRELSASGRLACVEEYYALPGREGTVETRRRRAAISERLWEKAISYGHTIARLPFVRMVAVTGALSVDNSEDDDDLDYLIITEPGRLWTCRACVLALVRLAARRGDVVCPNYFLSERALVMRETSLYTAREMIQMVPLAGFDLYRRMLELNPWVGDYLPNAGVWARPTGAPPERSGVTAAAEGLLRTPVGGWLEGWEMRRKLRKLGAQSAASLNPAESDFGPDWCKGHFNSHGQRTIAAMGNRLGGQGA
jgi:hypothetical protein